MINTISAVFSVFTKSDLNFELTDAHFKVEGLSDNTENATTLWTYETDLLAKANTLPLREERAYKIVVSKTGYKSYVNTLQLKQGSEIEIILEEEVKSVDVYLAGWQSSLATYWKNGIPVTLSSVQHSFCTNIIVSESGDIYVTGSEPGSKNAFYWKNGEKVLLPEEGFVRNIYLSGDDIYAMGQTKSSIPVYWKNGVKTELPTTTFYPEGSITTMIIDGADIYAAGTISEPYYDVDNYKPAFWKNGQLTVLPVPTFDRKGGYQHFTYAVKDLRISNGHIYMGGVGIYINEILDQSYAVYWKDGQIVQLNAPPTYAFGTGLDIDGNDVYVAGHQEGGNGTPWTGKYWKNGEEVIISEGANVNLYDIAVVNGDVYVAGDYKMHRPGNYSTASYWVNGERVQCGTGKPASFALGMCVVKR